MADAEDIEFQQELLVTYRRKLKHHLRQQAKLGAHSPFSLEEDIQEAYIQIARIKEILRSYGATVGDDPDDTPGSGSQSKEGLRALNIEAILASRRTRLITDGWRNGEAYKDTLLVPLPHSIRRIDRHDLRSFVERNTIRLRGFGGPTFPYDQYSHTASMRNVPDGCELVDAHPWPYQDWTFHTWSFSTDGTFFSRASLLEDHSTEEKRTAKILRYVWMLQDIVRPLLFVRAMLTKVRDIDAVGIYLYWGDMDQRHLFDSRGVFGILDAEKCQQPEISLSEQITMLTDLRATARNLAEQVIWLCNWRSFSEQALDRDIATMLAGNFPAYSGGHNA